MATSPVTPTPISTVVTQFTAQPNRDTDTPTQFSNNTDTFLSEINDKVTEYNSQASEFNTIATQTNTNAVSAKENAELAAASEIAATSAAAYKGLYTALTGALNKPASVYYNGAYWNLNNNLADVTASIPSVANPYWQLATNLNKSNFQASGYTKSLADPSYGTTANTCVIPDIAPLNVNGNSIDLASENLVLPSAPTVDALVGTGVTTAIPTQGNFYIAFDNPNDIYQAILTNGSAQSLTNTTYFQLREAITRLDLAYHQINKTTLARTVQTIRGYKEFTSAQINEITPVFDAYFGNAVSKGLWDDGTNYIVPIGGFRRFNSLRYHPVYNGLGSYTDSSGDNWFSATATAIASTYDCATDVGTGLGRPNGENPTYIYDNQFHDMRIDARKGISDDAKKVFQDAISNPRGCEGLVKTRFSGETTSTGTVFISRLGASSTRITYAGNPFQYIGAGETLFADVAHRGFIVQGASGAWYRAIEVNNSASNNAAIYLAHEYDDITADFSPSTYLVADTTESNITFANELPHTDLIGDPVNYPTDWISYLSSGKSIVGASPALVDDQGNSLIFDGILYTFKLDKKAITIHGGIRTTDVDTSPSNPTWSAFTPTSSLVANNVTLTNEPIGNGVLINYTAKVSPTTTATTATIKEVFPMVVATNSHSVNKGNAMLYGCLGKVGVSTIGLEQLVLENVSVGDSEYDVVAEVGKTYTATVGQKVLVQWTTGGQQRGDIFERLTSNATNITPSATDDYSIATSFWKLVGTFGIVGTPTHSTITLDSSNPQVKFFGSYAVASNGMIRCDVFSQEIIYDVTSGDDGQFSQLTNGTVTDTNTNEVITHVGTIYTNKFGE